MTTDNDRGLTVLQKSWAYQVLASKIADNRELTAIQVNGLYNILNPDIFIILKLFYLCSIFSAKTNGRKGKRSSNRKLVYSDADHNSHDHHNSHHDQSNNPTPPRSVKSSTSSSVISEQRRCIRDLNRSTGILSGRKY